MSPVCLFVCNWSTFWWAFTSVLFTVYNVIKSWELGHWYEFSYWKKSAKNKNINLMLLSTLWLFDINWKPLWAFDKLVAPIHSVYVCLYVHVDVEMWSIGAERQQQQQQPHQLTTNDSRKRTTLNCVNMFLSCLAQHCCCCY